MSAMFWGSANAQHLQPCLFDHALSLKEQARDGYKQDLFRSIENVKGNLAGQREDVITVNMVIHVVYKNAEENLPEAKIREQVDILNANYMRMNEDTVNLRDAFKPVAGKANIFFNLVEIRRVQTDAIFQPSLSSLPDHVKQSSKGGSDAVDPDHFLNIWICNIKPLVFFGQESPILGYAYPPDDLDNWPAGSAAESKNLDGVVLHYKAIGIGSFDVKGIGSIPMRGRTCVHEVGHYLGLRHISGDAGIFGPDCTGSDGVDDTPAQGIQSQFNCDENQNTCEQNVSGDLPDMIENYMDYSLETCQNTFTKGQVEIMRGVLMTHRPGITQMPAATPELVSGGDFKLYPNPANREITFEGTVQHVEISDLSGKIWLQSGGSPLTQLDVSTLVNGLYYVKINHGFVQKLAILH